MALKTVLSRKIPLSYPIIENSRVVDFVSVSFAIKLVLSKTMGFTRKFQGFEVGRLQGFEVSKKQYFYKP